MPATWQIILITAFGLFTLGTVVGSFINVCVYRIPYQKSLLWPGSRCPKCWNAVAARDNLPVLGWILLGGRCRCCRHPISVRYPLVEALVGVLFVSLFAIEVLHAPRSWPGEIPLWSFGVMSYHTALVALLVIATFIDYDLTIIPDSITVTGMIVALALGTWFPWVRLDPASASTHAAGFWAGAWGLIIGGGLTWSVRAGGSLLFRREAMGFGDVTLMAMIGAFLGWQAAVLAFFLAPFFGLAHALGKLVRYLGKRLRGVESSGADREIPYGPYLSMAAVALILSWPWIWPLWAKGLFETLGVVTLWMLGLEG